MAVAMFGVTAFTTQVEAAGRDGDRNHKAKASTRQNDRNEIGAHRQRNRNDDGPRRFGVKPAERRPIAAVGRGQSTHRGSHAVVRRPPQVVVVKQKPVVINRKTVVRTGGQSSHYHARHDDHDARIGWRISLGDRRPTHVTSGRGDRCCGHWETRTTQVILREGYYHDQWVQPVYETRYDDCGRAVRVLVTPGCYTKVYVQPVYRTQSDRVWVADRCVHRHPVRSSGVGVTIFGHVDL